MLHDAGALRAGLDGPRGLDIVDNVVPYIGGEEEKLEIEIAKMLDAPIAVAAHCHRVATIDGHLEAVSVELEKDATPEQAVEAFRRSAGTSPTSGFRRRRSTRSSCAPRSIGRNRGSTGTPEAG